MIDIKKELVATIKSATSYPVYYDLFYKPGAVPSVTYLELNDASFIEGDTLRYSSLRYQIKVYATTMDALVSTSIAIDAALKADGWTRVVSIETNDNTTFIKILRYIATGYEEVN
jgi:hypothetical protein